MQSASLVFCLLALMAIRVHSSPIFDINDNDNDQIDNSLEPNGAMDIGLVRKPWIEISKNPPKAIKRESGSTVVLECEASGSPVPTIIWLRDQIPITEIDFEGNSISELSYTGMAAVRSKLIINNFQPSGKNIYTCFARSGPTITKASTVVHTYHHKSHTMLSPAEYSLLNEEVLQKPMKPTIVSSFKTAVEDIGNSIVLPCRVEGFPKPEVSWVYNDSEQIPSDGVRHQITSSGDLVFRHLSWADMGQYTCIARNSLGEDVSNTFVYPLTIDK